MKVMFCEGTVKVIIKEDQGGVCQLRQCLGYGVWNGTDGTLTTQLTMPIQ